MADKIYDIAPCSWQELQETRGAQGAGLMLLPRVPHMSFAGDASYDSGMPSLNSVPFVCASTACDACVGSCHCRNAPRCLSLSTLRLAFIYSTMLLQLQ